MKVPVVTVVTDMFIKTSSDSSVSSGLIESRYRNFDLIYCSDSINSNGSNNIIDTRESSPRSDSSKHISIG